MVLEVVLDRELDHAAVDREQRFAGGVGVLVRGREVPVCVGELQRYIGVVIRGVELRQRMIDEVKGFKSQLELLFLPDLEVLEQRQIAIEERRALNVRPDDVAYLTRLRRRKAARVEVLS